MPPVLNSYIQAIIRKYGVTVNQAFEILSAALVLEKPFGEVYQDIWVGDGYDGGFDAVYIDEQTNVIYAFQSKNAASIAENDLMKLDTDFEDLFVSNNASGRQLNARLQARVAEYADYTRRGVVLVPHLFFVYSGRNDDQAHANNAPLAAQFSGRAIVPEFNVVDSTGLVARLSSLQRHHRDRVEFTFNPLETDIPTFSRQALFSFIVGQVKGASFRISARQLCELMDQEVRVNGFVDTLFSENVRGYLGRNKTNKKIFGTLNTPTQAPLFPFMNNGLTVVCETVSIPPGPQMNQYNVPVTNPVIVNGLQTARVIYDVYKTNPDVLEQVTVTLKVYESREQAVTELITEATNTQTSINFKDQMSNRSFNEHAQVFFAGQGVKYIFKRGDIVRGDDLTTGLADSVNNELVLKFWFATYHKDPHTAKTSRSSILENVFLASKGEHPDAAMNDLFSGDPESQIYMQLLATYHIQKLIADSRADDAETPGNDYLLHADEIIAYGMYLELERTGVTNNPTQQNVQDAYSTVQPRVQAIMEEERARRGELYSHTKYFKSDAIVTDYEAQI